MKTILRLLLLFTSLLGTFPVLAADDSPAKPPAAPVSPLEQKLRDGLYAEEAKQDLAAAAKTYQEIVASFDRDRDTAAAALFRLGEVYRKQNQQTAARDCFRRIAREFPDREPLARLARENLKALGDTMPEVAGAAATSGDPEQDKALARLTELEKSSPDVILNPKTSLKTNGCISYDEAITAGYVRVVEWFLDHGASVDKTPSEANPLSLAASFGHLPLIELLLSRKASIEGADTPDRPLTAAAANGHLAAVKLLAEKGAAMNETKKKSRGGKGAWAGQPLTAAIEGGQAAIVDFLLSKGVDPNMQGGQVLGIAVEAGNTALAKKLLEAKADPNLPKIPFTRKPRPTNVTQISSGHENLNQPGRPPREPSTGAPGNYVGGMGVIYDLPDEYRGYAQWRNGPNEDEFRALHIAAMHGDKEMVSLLLDYKAEADAKTPLGTTPLELACILGKRDVAGLLLKAGANADHAAPGGVRLVDFILARRDLKFYNLLREAGASVAGKSPSGIWPLESIGANGTSRLWGDEDHAAWIERLLNDGADPNGEPKFRPINLAAGLHSVEIVRQLQAKGADFTPDDSDAPLSVAVRNGFGKDKLPLIEALLKGGADPGARASANWLRSSPLADLNFLETIAAFVPDVDLLEKFLALKPPPGKSFTVVQEEYSAAQKSLESGKSNQVQMNPSGGRGIYTTREEFERVVKVAPALMQRLWDYQRLEWNRDLGSRVWYQSFDSSTSSDKLGFRYASAAKEPVNIVEALAYVFGQGTLIRDTPNSAAMQNGGLYLPDFSKLTILRCDVATGKILRREPVDLAALVEKGETANLPALQPGDILDAVPGDKREHTWRNFPEPVLTFFSKVLAPRAVNVTAGDWKRSFKVTPWRYGFRWDPSTDVLAVEPTLSSVIRFLPRPDYFYRMNAVRVTSKGKEPVVLDLTKSPEPLIVKDGDDISVEAIPENDPALVARMKQGLFVSRESDGFLREVFHDPDTRPPGLEWDRELDRQLVIRFCLDSESVLPFMDLPNRKVTTVGGTPWGDRMEIPRLKDKDGETWSPDDWASPGQPLTGGKLAFRLNFLADGSSAVHAFYYQGVTFHRTPDGWTIEKFPDARGVMSRTLADAVRVVTSPDSQIRRDMRVPAWGSWELRREKLEAPLAVFTPGKDPLPLIFLQEGDSIRLSPDDANRAVPPAYPKEMNGRMSWSYENAGLFNVPQPISNSNSNPNPSRNRRRVVLPTQ
jgi:ankyrin repeat protein